MFLNNVLCFFFCGIEPPESGIICSLDATLELKEQKEKKK